MLSNGETAAEQRQQKWGAPRALRSSVREHPMGGMIMYSRIASAAVACIAACGLALAAEPASVQGTIVKVDTAKKTLTVKTDDGVKAFSVSKETKFFGPRGGASDDGIEDDRLVAGASVRIVPNPRGRWVKEVHLLSGASAKRPAHGEDEQPATTAGLSRKKMAEKTEGAMTSTGEVVRGTLVKVDRTRKTLTVHTEDGTRTFMTGKDTKFFGSRGGASEEGINDERLVAGAEVQIVPTPAGRAAREVHLMSKTSARMPRPADDTKTGTDKDADKAGPAPAAARMTRAPRVSRTPAAAGERVSDDRMDKQKAPVATDKDESKSAPAHHGAAKPVDGVEGRILAVDVDSRHITVQLKTGRKQELTVTDDTQFIGPRGGVSDRGIKDDRVMSGAEVTLVFTPGGRALKEVHLPFRNDIERGDKNK